LWRFPLFAVENGADPEANEQVTNRQLSAEVVRDFKKRFLALPGEIRNQIYDELFTLDHESRRRPLFRANFMGKASHGGATFLGPYRLPETPWSSLRLIGHEGALWDELFDRWCSQVSFNIVEAWPCTISTDMDKSWYSFRKKRPQASSSNLVRYINSDASQMFETSALWFRHMRVCTLRLHLFEIDALLCAGTRGKETLRASMAEVAALLHGATMLKNLTIDILLWPSKYSRVKEWNMWSKDHPAKDLPRCFKPLESIPGVQRIGLYGGKVIRANWDAEGPQSGWLFNPTNPEELCSSQSMG